MKNPPHFMGWSINHDTERLSISFKLVARIGKSYAFLGEEIPAPVIP